MPTLAAHLTPWMKICLSLTAEAADQATRVGLAAAKP